ncbi:MAG: OmpA family protein [Acidimicrobiales bacterium]
MTTTTRPPAPKVPVADLPPHEAVYRDGKLYLQGTLPNRKLADLFRRKAVEVIGVDNVVVNYQFDSRVPTPTDGHVRVDERFVFGTGSATVDPAYFKVFDLGVAVLKLNPQATMRIRGYTDDTGSPTLNKVLSERRASAAADYLVAHGIDRRRLTVIGFGPADPVVPNDSDEHRAENRRIEVDLYHLLG